MAVSSDTAVLRVAVTTALGAQPLENALVMVSTAPDESGSRQLLYSVRTDSGGMTPPMTFSTPPRENSRPRSMATFRSQPCTSRCFPACRLCSPSRSRRCPNTRAPRLPS